MYFLELFYLCFPFNVIYYGSILVGLGERHLYVSYPHAVLFLSEPSVGGSICLGLEKKGI